MGIGARCGWSGLVIERRHLRPHRARRRPQGSGERIVATYCSGASTCTDSKIGVDTTTTRSAVEG
jgi:hypothetical protein